MSQLIKKWEDIDNVQLPASTVLQNGAWMSYNGTGSAIPATASGSVIGTSLQTIATTDPDYASAKQVFYQKAGAPGKDEFTINIGAGVAAASMVGSPFNLHDSVSLDVSGAGTQFVITRFISTTLVVVSPLLVA